MGNTPSRYPWSNTSESIIAIECKEHSQFVIPRSCNETRVCYCQCLKALTVSFSIATMVLIGGCADPLEKPLTQEAGEKFQRGITGHGSLGPIDRPNDPTFKSPSAAPTNP